MRRVRLALAVLLAGLGIVLHLGGPDTAQAKVREEVIDLAVEVTDIRGRAISHTIKVTVLRDDARARSPFLILNHGRSASRDGMAATSVTRYLANARYFASQGYAVFMPLRVGYGETGGPDVEYSGRCETRNFPPVYEAAAAQTLATIAYAKAQTYIDAQNGLVVGQSFGGATAVAVAAKNVAGVRAAVNFAGGGGGRPATHPGQPCSAERMTALFASYGATARIPTLWLYSANDKYWGPDLPRTWFKAFVDGGGSSQFVGLPPYREDGHPIFTGQPDAWKPAFEDFLRSCCR